MRFFSPSPLLLLLFLSFLSLSASRIRNDNNPTGRDIHIVNESDVKVDIFWVHPQTQERVKSVDEGILKSTDSVINSFVGHRFEVVEVARKSTGTCRGEKEECRKTEFVVTSNEDQRFIITSDMTIKYEDARTRAMEKAQKVSEECPMPQVAEDGSMPDLKEWAECLQKGINDTLEDSRQEIEFQASVRKDMGQRLVNYACEDEEFPASISSYNQTLQLGFKGRAQRNPQMQYLFQSESNKVVLIDSLVARSQCKWLEETAKKNSNNNGRIEWSKVDGDVAIRTVVERLYKALEQVLDYTEDEGFLEFHKKQQQESGRDDPLFELDVATSDSGGRRFLLEDAERPLLATFLLFCEVPETGGAIHFPKTGVHVKPKANQALLITYLDPHKEENQDEPFTGEHVQCPVGEGTRKTLSFMVGY